MRCNFLMFLIKDDEYERKITIIKELERMHEKICYICLNDTASSIIKELDTRGLNTRKFIFIDTLSSYYEKRKSSDQCFYVSSPSATNEMINTISKVDGKCDVFVFDTISELLAYLDASSILRFTHDVLTRNPGKIVYIVSKEDTITKREIQRLVDDLVMFADKTTDLNAEYLNNKNK